MFKFISKIFPSKHEKDVKELIPYLEEINTYFEEYQKLSDEELKQKTVEFKNLIKERTQE
jgi:preprotein translocase subunit SecA